MSELLNDTPEGYAAAIRDLCTIPQDLLADLSHEVLDFLSYRVGDVDVAMLVQKLSLAGFSGTPKQVQGSVNALTLTFRRAIKQQVDAPGLSTELKSFGASVAQPQAPVAAMSTGSIVARPKVLVMGDPAVGKSALTQVFHSNGQRFPKAYNMTCGVEFCVKAVNVPETEDAVELHIFDTAGQDVFAEMMPEYWQDAKGIVLVFDVTRVHTLEACGIWYQRALEAIGASSLPGVVVANKIDLRERLVVNRQAGQQMAGSLGMPYFETSALDSNEIDAPFVALAKALHASGGEPGSPM